MIGSETFLKFCPNFLRWYGTGFLKQPAGAALSLAEDSRVLALGVYISPTIGKSPPLVRTDAYETLSWSAAAALCDKLLSCLLC